MQHFTLTLFFLLVIDPLHSAQHRWCTEVKCMVLRMKSSCRPCSTSLCLSEGAVWECDIICKGVYSNLDGQFSWVVISNDLKNTTWKPRMALQCWTYEQENDKVLYVASGYVAEQTHQRTKKISLTPEGNPTMEKETSNTKLTTIVFAISKSNQNMNYCNYYKKNATFSTLHYMKYNVINTRMCITHIFNWTFFDQVLVAYIQLLM